MFGAGQTLHPSTPLRGQGEGTFKTRSLAGLLLTVIISVGWNMPGKATDSVLNEPKIFAPCSPAHSQEQQTKIAEVRVKFNRIAGPLKVQLQKKQTEVQQLLSLPNPSAARLRQLMTEKLALETQLQKASLDSYQAIKKLLTPEQFIRWMDCYSHSSRTSHPIR